jgi:insecticidal toxin complex protein TccC
MDNPSVHHATPTLAVVDPRGLAVRGAAYWRSNAGQAPQARVTRQVFDAAGREIEQWDARLSVSALRHGFSMTGTVLATDSVDAGWRVSMHGQTAETLTQWDSRGTQQDFEYDTSLRPMAVMEQARGEAVRVVERFEYGATGLHSGNQCGRLIRHDDPAGTRHMPEYDLLGLARSEVSHFLMALDTPDWPLGASARDALLESDPGLQSRWAYDPRRGFAEPCRCQRQPPAVQLHRGRSAQGGLAAASGRVGARSSPGARTSATTRAIRSSGKPRAMAWSPRPSTQEMTGVCCDWAAGLPGTSPLQDLRYEVDAVGNVVGIEDHASPVRFF